MKTNWELHKQRMLKDPEVKKAYDALEPEFRLASELIKARIDKELTQDEVAKKAGLSRTVITRLESGTTNPTISSVNRVAKVLGKEVGLINTS